MKRVLLILILSFCLLIPCFAQESNSLSMVIDFDRCGFIDRTGKIVIEPQFQCAGDFYEGRAAVKLSGSGPRYDGYIDETGKVVIAPQYDRANNFSEGLAAVGIGTFLMHGFGDHQFGFIDKSGKMVIEPQFENVGRFSEGLAAVKNKKGLWGYIDKSGKLAVAYNFENAFEFSEGLARVRAGDKWGYINKSGEFAIKPKYNYVTQFSEGLAAVKTGGSLIDYTRGSDDFFKDLPPEKWEYIDINGNVVIQLAGNTRGAGAFSEDLAPVSILGKDGYLVAGYINKSGKFAIEPQFGLVEEFSEGAAKVITGSGFGLIDQTGRLFFSCKYPSECESVGNFHNGLALIYKGRGNAWANLQDAPFGYVDKTGRLVWPHAK